jgi:hypothetical protein
MKEKTLWSIEGGKEEIRVPDQGSLEVAKEWDPLRPGPKP